MQIISKKSEQYEDLIYYLMNETNFFYKDCFWMLCFFFRKFENFIFSNKLYDMDILNTIDNILDVYEDGLIAISTIELIFKVLLSIITNENIQFIRENFIHFLDAAIYFKDDFLEPSLFIILFDENSFDFDENPFDLE